MGKYVGLTTIIAENMIEGSAFKANGETVTINEEKMKTAREAMSEAVRGMMRDFWSLAESSPDSLENLDGEVKIEELMDKTGSTGTVPSLGESLNFDIKALVESMMEDGSVEDEKIAADGDEDFANAQIGADDAGMGGDLEQDGSVDASAGNLGDENMDSMDDTGMGDESGFEDDLDIEGEGEDDGFGDLSFADLSSENSSPDATMNSGDEMGDDFGGDSDFDDSGEEPIDKPMGESKMPLAKMKGKKG